MIEKCPFCKNTNQDEFSVHKEWRKPPTVPTYLTFGVYSVSCSCGARGPDGHTPEEAVERWNKRAEVSV
jgi:hypothetical protein